MAQSEDYRFIVSQIEHWLGTPANGYLGSDYGVDLKQYLHRPMSRFEADALIEKMRRDIPVLSLVSERDLNILSFTDGDDGVRIVIQLADRFIRAL